jgi:putative phosphoesterase
MATGVAAVGLSGRPAYTGTMDVGLISDVHGNRVALAAVLADMPAVDALVNAGDVVGYNPWPAACVEAMQDPTGLADAVPGGPVPTVMGNHDRAVAEGSAFRFNDMARAGVEHARSALDDDHLEWLADLPDERRLFEDRVHVVHGHPDDPDHYTRPHEFGPDLLRDGADALVMGHTHVQHHETYDEGVVLNPGSVGQPRDDDPRAAYAVLDLDALTVAEHRVDYDVDRVQAQVREVDLPERIGTRLSEGR